MNLLKQGWLAYYRIHDDISDDPDDDELDQRPVIIPDQWMGALYPIPQLLGMDLDGCIHEQAAIRLVYQKLYAALKQQDEVFLNKVTSLTVAEALNDFHDQINVPSKLDFALRQPRSFPRTIQYLIANAVSPMKSLTPLTQLAWGLVLMACLKHKWKPYEDCPLCFRCTSPGSKYCDEHRVSHTETARNGRPNQDVVHRLGKRVIKDMYFLESKPQQSVINFAYRYSMWNLFFYYRPGRIDDIWLEKVARLLNRLLQSPLVLAKCDGEQAFEGPLNAYRKLHPMAPTDTDDDAIQKALDDYYTVFEILRKALDRNDYNKIESHWEIKIREAEEWFATEKYLRGEVGKRGKGKKTEKLVMIATAYARKGLSKGEIAKSLSVAPNVLSNWIRRYPRLAAEFTSQNNSG